MCLAPLLPCPSGGGLPWSVTHCWLRPGRYALMCLGVLDLWVQLEVIAERGCWDRDYLSLKKTEIFLLLYSTLNGMHCRMSIYPRLLYW